MKFKVGDKVRIVGDLNLIGITPGNLIDVGWEFLISAVDGDDWYRNEENEYLIHKKCLELVEPDINEPTQFISLDYRTEYHKKVEECEYLTAQLNFLWETIIKEK